MATTDKKAKAARQTGLYVLILIAIAVAANLLSAGTYWRKDTTRTERFSLSEGSARLVRELQSPLQIDAYVTRGLPQLDAFVRDLTDLLKEYQRRSGGKLRFTIIEPTSDDLKKQAQEEGLQPTAFGQSSATDTGQTAIAEGYMGLVIKYGSEKTTIERLNPGYTMGLEFGLTNKIRELRDKADNLKHRIGVVTGKKDLGLDDPNLIARQGQGATYTMKGVLEQAFPFYTVEVVDLKGGDEPIDGGLAGLIITQPGKGEKYSEKELRRIDEFLMKGNKALAVFAGAATLEAANAEMTATLDLHGLEALLQGYGIDLQKNLLLDYGAQAEVPVMTNTGMMQALRDPSIAHVQKDARFEDDEALLDDSTAPFFRLQELAVPYASGLKLLRDKQPAEVSMKIVARTTPATSSVTEATVQLNPARRENWNPRPPYEQHGIAAMVEGPLKSAFAGKEPPAGVAKVEKAAAPSRVFVLASGYFLTNPYAYAGNGPELGGQFRQFGAVGGDRVLQMLAGAYANRYLSPAILSLKNTFDWLTGDMDLLAVSAKLLAEPNLSYSDVPRVNIDPEKAQKMTDEQLAEEARKLDEDYRNQRTNLQSKVQWTLTLGMPALFALFGLLRWRLRLSRRNLLAASGVTP